jgi:hypothetical protein
VKANKHHINKAIVALLQSLNSLEGEDDASSDGDGDESDDDDEMDDTDGVNDKSTPQWNALSEDIKGRVMEIVWAKSPGWPAWPSLIYHPANVSGKLKKDALKCCGSKYLILGYNGGANPWQYVAHKQCIPFDPLTISEYEPKDKLGKPQTGKTREQWDAAVKLAQEELLLDKWSRAQWVFDAAEAR